MNVRPTTGIESAVTITAPKALHERGPRGKLRDQHPRTDIHTRLHRLRRNDDTVPAAVDQHVLLLPAIRSAKARMNERHILLSPGLLQRREDRLRTIHSVHNDKRKSARDMLLQHHARDFAGITILCRLGQREPCLMQGLHRFQPMLHLRPVFLFQLDARPPALRQRMIHRGKTRTLQRGTHPPRRTTAVLKPLPEMTEAIKLGACFDPDSHQLRLIHHPEAVIIQQAEVHWPAVPRHAVAPIQRSREQHVLCTDQDRVLLRVHIPFSSLLPTHEQVKADLPGMGFLSIPEQPMALQPFAALAVSLLNQRPHRKAIDQPSRPLPRPLIHSVPQPCERNRSRLAKPSRHRNQPGVTSPLSQPPLIVIRRRIASRLAEELFEFHIRSQMQPFSRREHNGFTKAIKATDLMNNPAS